MRRKASCGAPKPCTEVCATACAEACAEVCAEVAPESTGCHTQNKCDGNMCIAETEKVLRRNALWSFVSPSALLPLELFVASMFVSSRTLLNIQNNAPMDPTDSIKKSSIPLPETHQHSALHTHEPINSIRNSSTPVPMTPQHSKLHTHEQIDSFSNSRTPLPDPPQHSKLHTHGPIDSSETPQLLSH